MSDIASRRCFHHPEREAAVICPECKKNFCRECVTEHDDRMLCAQCLQKLLKTPLIKRFRLRYLNRAGQCLLGLLVAWLFFYYLGEVLLSVPVSYHEGTIWKEIGSGVK